MMNKSRYKLGVSKLSLKGPSNKYFGLCGPQSLCRNYSTPLLESKRSHTGYVKEQAWLVPKKVCLWALKFEFHIFVMSHELFFF